MKKKNKLRIVSDHPANTFLNFCYNNIKSMIPETTDIYERLELLHQQGKDTRDKLFYLSSSEIEDFLYTQGIGKANYSELHIKKNANMFTAALGWKQFQQVYKFNPALLEELFNIDISEDKYATISKEEVMYLPCYNFFVEYETTIDNIEYSGFYVYFDTTNQISETGQIHVMFVCNPKNYPRNARGVLERVDFYGLTLIYSSDYKEYQTEPFDLLYTLNTNLFQKLGPGGAMELITHITQMITYLAATNADFSRIKKPTKKPDIKRTKITDSEYEKWEIGNTIYKGHKIPTRLLDATDGAYEKVESKQVEETEEVESKPCDGSYRRKTGYHMRPHMRRAHWKHYWYGKKDGSEERVRRRKFVSAVFIDKNTDEEIQIPTRKVVTYRF